jgi:pyrroline-5-carboxylate reductase
VTASTLLVGCGRLGGAILTGWRLTGAVAMPTLAILSPSPKTSIEDAVSDGARHNPADLSGVSRVVLAVKPARWREVSAGLVQSLSPDAVIVSVMAGVPAIALSGVFGSRPIARVMPTTAVSAAKGVATCWWQDPAARETAVALFGPIAQMVEVERETLIDVATAVSGSGAAYVYAFVRAMARAGEAAGLEPEQARVLALATASGALARLEDGGEADALIAEVASPGGTTQAGLAVLEPDLSRLVNATVQAALAKTRELSAQ